MSNLQNKLLELEKLVEDNKYGSYDDWKREVMPTLSKGFQQRLNIITPFAYDEWSGGCFLDSEIKKINAIVADTMYKEVASPEYKKDLEIMKLMNAREENINFEDVLSEMICGDNDKFPYKSSYYITLFFKELGYPFEHDGSTRRIWIANRLRECNTFNIHKIITQGLFKKKYFTDNKVDIEPAKEEFKQFIEDSITSNEVFDLADLFNLNVKNELLFNKETKTEDETLNDLVDKAKQFFIKGEKQIALEKIWDAFERMKTVLAGKDKKDSANKLLDAISTELTKDFFEDEFKSMTTLGNEYQIRHHEQGKKAINENLCKEYLFFRMLSLIDFSLNKIEGLKS